MPSKQERQSVADSSKVSFNVLSFHFRPYGPILLGFASTLSYL
jgi:hypothetical protein